jgi:hypothetical protein
MDDFQKTKSEYIQMSFRKRMGHKIDEVRYKNLERRLKENSVANLVYRGEFQVIVEDFDVIEDIDSAVERWGEKFLDSLPPKMAKAVREMYLNKDTRTYQYLEKTFQYSDFAAKYALWRKYHIGEGMSEAEVINMMNDYFVDYAPPSNKYAQYLDDMGIFMFNKYFFRIGRGIWRMAKTKTFSLLTWKTMETATGLDMPDIIDTAYDFETRLDLTPWSDFADLAVPDVLRMTWDVL